MSRLLPLVALAFAGTANAGAVTGLDLAGACPGPVDITITGTPGADFAVVASDAAGSYTIPSGRCAGVDIGLAGPHASFGPMPDLDDDGTITVSPDVPDGACAKSFVAIDLTTCAVSPVTTFGGGGVGEDSTICADNPLWMPVDCMTPEWVWTSSRTYVTVESADAARTLWTDDWGLTCSLDGTGWVSTEVYTMAGCNDDWYHIGGRYTGNCGGHDGEDIRRLTMGDDTCYNYTL